MKNINKFIENVLFQGAAISRGFFHCCAICALTFSAGAQETDNYYWRGGTWGQSTELLRIDLAGNWAADSSGETVHEISPSETSNLIFDYANIADRQHARINVYNRTVAVNSVASYVPTEMHMQTGHSLTVLSDWTSSVSSDTRYSASYRTEDSGDKKSVRFAADTANFLTVGGDMTLSTDKYFTSRIRLGSQQGSSAYTLTIGGALSFVKNGVDAVGYHAFDMIAADSTTGTAFALDVGGLRSSGKAVYMTTAKNGSVGINFNDNSSGSFAGGSFEGVFAADSGVSSQLDITMNGSGRQEMTIYKASNGSLHGFENDLDGKADMSIGNLTVNNGEFVMNTEVAVENLYLSGGRLKFSSAEKVGGMTIDGGTLLFGGTINVGDLTVAADSADMVFSAEDLAAHEITVFEFDYLTGDFDANSVFSAYNEFGQELGGRFELTGEMGSSGSLVYVVPEPAAVAAFIGAAALMFALRRGGRR